MGGSSLFAELFNSFLPLPCWLTPVRDYSLPLGTNELDLVLVASFSGNTEETLAVLEEALDKGIPTIALTHGGRLRELAVQHQVPLIELPSCIQPRCATGYFFSAILCLLEFFELIPAPEEELKALSAFLRERQPTYEINGQELAKALLGKVPIVYGPNYLEGACRIWKIKFNENCKIQSFYNAFPELNHNEMVGFTQRLMNPFFIYLLGSFMHPRVQKRMDLFEKMMGKETLFFRIPLQGKNRLQEIFDSLGFADFASFYLAKAYHIDPTPVAMVEDFKKQLAG